MFAAFRSTDYRWVQKQFPRTARSAIYSDSWLYLTQACREALGPLGAYYKTEKFFVGLGKHRSHWVLVRPSGKLPRNFMMQLVDFGHASLQKQPIVFVKKTNKTLENAILDQSRRYGAKVMPGIQYPWDASAPLDDDTYPERIVRTSDALRFWRTPGVEAQKLRSKLRQYDKYSRQVVLKDVQQVGIDAVSALISRHFGDAAYVKSYLNMLQILARSQDEQQLGNFVACINNEPVAFFGYEKLDSHSCGVYASIAARGYPGLSEAMMMHLLRECAAKQIEFVNLGGSESPALDRFKAKFGDQTRQYNLFALDLSPLVYPSGSSSSISLKSSRIS